MSMNVEEMTAERHKALYGSKAKSQLGEPSESAEQRAVVNWAEWSISRYPELTLLYHIPNEGKRTKATGGRLKAEGLKAGVPDLCLPVARGRYHGLYIEMKTLTGTPSEKQKKWITALSEQGYCALVCHGCDNAITVIQNYLKGTIV